MNRIFFFDIDGTLAVRGNTPEAHIRALKLLKDKGYLTFICTGRAPYYAQKLYGDLVSGYVTCNGRYILHEGKKLYSKAFSEEEFAFYMNWFDELDCGCYMVSDEKLLVRNLNERAMEHAKKDYGEERIITEPGNLPYYTFDIFYKDLAHRDRIIEAMRGRVVVNDHGGHGSADCSTADFDKGSAVACLMEHFGIDKEHCYAFGDGYNDQAMFREAGNRIAMGNAVEALKEKATMITGTVQEGGILQALEQLGI